MLSTDRIFTFYIALIDLSENFDYINYDVLVKMPVQTNFRKFSQRRYFSIYID